MAESLVLAPLVKEDGRTRSETFWRLFKRVGPCVRSFVLEVNLDTILSFIWPRSAKDVSGHRLTSYLRRSRKGENMNFLSQIPTFNLIANKILQRVIRLSLFLFLSFSIFFFPSFYMRSRIFIRGCVRRSVTNELNFWEMGSTWTK